VITRLSKVIERPGFHIVASRPDRGQYDLPHQSPEHPPPDAQSRGTNPALPVPTDRLDQFRKRTGLGGWSLLATAATHLQTAGLHTVCRVKKDDLATGLPTRFSATGQELLYSQVERKGVGMHIGEDQLLLASAKIGAMDSFAS